MMRLIGLFREAECSPGRHRSNDAQLLEQVAQALRQRGFRVDLMTFEDATASRCSAAMVFSMCQGWPALETIRRWELNGARVVNSPRASLNTYRDRLHTVMEAAGVPFPPTRLVATARESDPAVDVNGGVWLKRGDVHASVSADVQWIDSTDGLRAGLRDFASRGVAHAALQQHCEGDEVKFYGVARGGWFRWFYASDGLYHPSGRDGGRYKLDVAALRRLTETAAAAAGLDIFGGDVIVAPTGELTLIDLNDWPSFAPCRDAASEAIADHLMRRVDAAWNTGLVSSANESAV
jgi:glutathione synthase/RimK-type ligase-like ATP-grasp enzyme